MCYVRLSCSSCILALVLFFFKLILLSYCSSVNHYSSDLLDMALWIMPIYYLHWQQNKKSRSSIYCKSGFLVAISKSWLWTTSATLLTSYLEHKLLDQKIKEFKEKEAIFGWVGLAFFVSLVFKWTICTVSFALILAAHTTKLQAQLFAHPFIRRLWRTCKKTHPLCNLQTGSVLQLLLLLTWAIWEEAAPARFAAKPPIMPNLSVLPTSFPEQWSSSVRVHWHALGRAIPVRN